MKQHQMGCPSFYNPISNIPVPCQCPEMNYSPTYGRGSIGYVAPVDRMPEVIELLERILCSLNQIPNRGG